jgi:N-acetylneuraminic acid mutarotase
MKYEKNRGGKISLIIILSCFTLFTTCKKKENIIEVPIDKPSSLSVLSVQQRDVNKFVVTFEIKMDTFFVFDSYGLIVAKDTNVENGRTYSFKGLSPVNEISDSCLLDSLNGNTVYHFRVFAKKNNVTYLSTDKTISVGALEITGIRSVTPSAEPPYASRNEAIDIFANFNDNDFNTIKTQVKIGGISATVLNDYGHAINVLIPGTITPGKKTIEIDRNGLSIITTDTLNILSGKYDQLNDFPFDYRSDFGSCQIGNTAYMVGGLLYATTGPGGWNNDILTYDINNDQWNTTNYQHYPKDFIVHNECFTVNGKIYCIPGEDTLTYSTQFQSSGRVFEFDPASNTWTEKAPFPGQKRFDPQGWVANNKIYIMGGNANQPLSDLWEYTPATDTWVRKADFPGTPTFYFAIFPYNNKAFVFGGLFPKTYSDGLWEYDIQSDTWQHTPVDDRIIERFKPVYFTIGNKGYLLGGSIRISSATGTDYTDWDESWELNLDTRKWNRISNFEAPGCPGNFTPYYTKPTAFISNGSAIIYDRGKMIKFTPD